MLRLRIRTKFIGILIIASVLPLVIALVAAQLLGYRYYRAAQGQLFETIAQHLANSLSLAINKQIEDLDEWITLSGFPRAMEQLPPAENTPEKIAKLEKLWPTLDEKSPRLKAILTNDLAVRLKDFRDVNPLFVKLFATDREGRVVAATDKTNDYSQAGNEWWQRAVQMPSRSGYIQGITYDESGRVYSIDVAFPVRDPHQADGPVLGVVKGVIDATPLLSSLEPGSQQNTAIRQVIMGTGEILIRLSGTGVTPLNEHISPPAIERIAKKQSGWMLTDLGEDDLDLVGFAALHLINQASTGQETSGLKPMFVLIYKSVPVAMAPVRKQMYGVGIVGALLVFGFAFTGYFIAGKKIIDPVEKLRSAVQGIAASAKGSPGISPESEQGRAITRKYPALENIRGVKTGDELESLAGDFAFMAQKVIGYHEELEAEIAAKTSEIQRDLQLAREFQEALMPRSYPQIPCGKSADHDLLTLNFHHVYKPASSVGGDFFDVLKLSDHSAGIFIADVMGHGARSALVTAILRTLLQDLSDEANDPAGFLTLINNHFHEIVSQSREFIFVSAFYLVIDTQTALASFASAGHPSPFFADRTRSRIQPLIEHLHNNPALGLFPDSHYEKWTKNVISGDLFVLFTDGLHEATDPSGTEYGLDRLRQAIAENIDQSAIELNKKIVEDLERFVGDQPLGDDICLVTAEICPSPIRPAPSRQQQRQVLKT